MTGWKETAAAKVAARDAFIPLEWRISLTEARNVLGVPATCGILTTSELEITETDAVTLVEQMIKKQLKSRDVTMAFCKRAAIAQQLVRSHISSSSTPM